MYSLCLSVSVCWSGCLGVCWLQCVRVCVLELSCWLFVAVSEEKRDSEKADERDLLRESSIKRKPDLALR